MMKYIYIICVLLMLVGCKTKERLIEVVRIDTTYIDRLMRDSIYKHDSIYVHEYMRGDTVYRDKDRWHTLYKDRLIHDSIYVNNKQYIRYTVTEKLSWYKELMANYAQYIIGLLLAILAGVIVYHRMHRQQKK